MKPTMALKPLVFALAALIAVAAQADNGDKHNNNNNSPDPLLALKIAAGSSAIVSDAQTSDGNKVLNQGTRNDAKVDNSLNGSNGNMGANVAAGNGNQQDNASAIATADEEFTFGTALAATTANQLNTGNTVKNQSSQNMASVVNSGSNGSGNIGINATSGDFNQQKNNLAISVSGGRVAVAAAAANQVSTGLNVTNKADRTHEVKDLKASIKLDGTYKGKGEGTVGGNSYGDNDKGGNGGNGGNNGKQPLQFKEEGTFTLSGVATYQVLTPTGWKNPVTNTATLSNSMNNFSGNGGVNVSSGVGNQQSNSLSIAAGCKACL